MALFWGMDVMTSFEFLLNLLYADNLLIIS